MSTRRSGHRAEGDAPSDAGDTLLEVVIALVIVGLAGVALLGTLAESIWGSANHRQLATIDTVLRSAAESAKYQIELRTSSTPLFSRCASVNPATNAYNGQPVTFNVPSGFSVAITGIKYWDDSGATPGWTSSASTCTTDESTTDKSGFQLLSLKVTAPTKQTETLSVGLRNPS